MMLRSVIILCGMSGRTITLIVEKGNFPSDRQAIDYQKIGHSSLHDWVQLPLAFSIPFSTQSSTTLAQVREFSVDSPGYSWNDSR